MKELWNKKYALIAFYAFLTLAAAIVFKMSVAGFGSVLGFFGDFIGILKSFVIGFAIAYLINPLYSFFRNKVFGKLLAKVKLKKQRSVIKATSMTVSYIIALSVIAVLLWAVIPQVCNSIVTCVNNLINNYDTYYNNINNFVSGFTNGGKGVTDVIATVSKYIRDYLNGLKLSDFMTFTSVTFSIASNVFALTIGIIISIYMLYNKEVFCAQIKKTGFSLLSKKMMYRLQKIVTKCDEAFGQYLIGIMIDALIVGTVTTIFCLIMKYEYAVLIGVIVGLTNMIPFFGPYIGGVPAVLLSLAESPMKALYMIIFLVVMQQIDSNFVSPKVVGDKTGLSAIWIVFAILVGGGFFGILGMFLAVPLFSVIYVLFKDFVSERLESKKMSTDTADYYATASVEEKYTNDD